MKKHRFVIVGIATSMMVSSYLWANGNTTHGWSPSRPDGHAPIGVMADHTHEEGELMLSYRYMFMGMDGNRDGTSGLSKSDIFDKGYMIAPIEMTMEMHMVGAMYAPAKDLTIMAMLPYALFSMDHETQMGVEFTTESKGIGDFRLTAMYVLHRWKNQHLQLNAGTGFPTGSIDQKDDTPAGINQKLPYPMQLGSGTFDLLPGITYLGQTEHWSWGGQTGFTFRLGRNDEGYSLGDRAALTGWGARKWTDCLSTSLRLEGQAWGDIDSRDNDLNPAMIPTADPDLRNGQRVDLLFGMNFCGQSGWVKGHRLAVEYGFPVYQWLDGPQLETDWLLVVGWQYAW